MNGGVVQQITSTRTNCGAPKSTASFQMTGGAAQSTALLETTGGAAEPHAPRKWAVDRLNQDNIIADIVYRNGWVELGWEEIVVFNEKR
jgi:hypothetical protein